MTKHKGYGQETVTIGKLVSCSHNWLQEFHPSCIFFILNYDGFISGEWPLEVDGAPLRTKERVCRAWGAAPWPPSGGTGTDGGSSFMVKASMRSGTSHGSRCFSKLQMDWSAQRIHQRCLWGQPCGSDSRHLCF